MKEEKLNNILEMTTEDLAAAAVDFKNIVDKAEVEVGNFILKTKALKAVVNNMRKSLKDADLYLDCVGKATALNKEQFSLGKKYQRIRKNLKQEVDKVKKEKRHYIVLNKERDNLGDLFIKFTNLEEEFEQAILMLNEIIEILHETADIYIK